MQTTEIPKNIIEWLNVEWTNAWFNYITNLPNCDWGKISTNANVTYDRIMNNLDKKWHWYQIAKHSNLTFDNLINIETKISKLKDTIFSSGNVCENPNITMEMVRKRPDYYGKRSCRVFHNVDVTMADIQNELKNKNGRKNCFSCVFHYSSSPNITYDIIKNNPKMWWDWAGISKNPNITMDIIRQNPDEKWDWQYVNRNPNFTIDMMLEFRHISCHWYRVSMHPNMTMEIIDKYRIDPENKGEFKNIFTENGKTYVPWYWQGVAENPNVTIDYLVKIGKEYGMANDWFNQHLCSNPLTLQKQNYIDNHAKFILLVAIHEYYTNPVTCNSFDSYKNVEYVFADNFLVSRIVKY